MKSEFHATQYELQLKDIPYTEALKQIADHVVKEIHSTAGDEVDVQIHVEPEVKDKQIYSVSLNVYGPYEPISVRKEGKNIFSLLRKVRKTVLRRLHKATDRRLSWRRKSSLKEQFV